MAKSVERKVFKGVRLPPAMKAALEENERRTHIPEPIQIRLALEEYLGRAGLWPYPPQDGRAKPSRRS